MKQKITSDSQDVSSALKDAAGIMAATHNLNDDTVYELRLHLQTPAIFAQYKADIPAPGLPMLDGYLKFLAFRYAVHQVISRKPELCNELLWQWNDALRGQGWIDFPIPIRQVNLSSDVTLYDCSVGLPVTEQNQILYPAGAFFSPGTDLTSYPSEKNGPVDQIALRRRSTQYPVETVYGHLLLTGKDGKLNISSGATKALDNRVYHTLTDAFVFFFRGDKLKTEELVNFAKENRIGIGKKTTLGYGQIKECRIMPTTRTATLAKSLNFHGLEYLSLLKTVPLQEMRRRCIRRQGNFIPVGLLQPNEWQQNQALFGADEVSIASPIETYDRFYPPYWRKEGRRQVLQYGSLLMRRQ